jgi:heme-degrading monooxygenase HmoA
MYVIIWEFIVKPGHESEFEEAYGQDGGWVKLFAQDQGYLGTELLRDTSDHLRYITIDRWVSSKAYEAFKEKRNEEYGAVDARCEGLTEHEILVGTFITGPSPSFHSPLHSL